VRLARTLGKKKLKQKKKKRHWGQKNEQEATCDSRKFEEARTIKQAPRLGGGGVGSEPKKKDLRKTGIYGEEGELLAMSDVEAKKRLGGTSVSDSQKNGEKSGKR